VECLKVLALCSNPSTILKYDGEARGHKCVPEKKVHSLPLVKEILRHMDPISGMLMVGLLF
jgi:hypothetical protein